MENELGSYVRQLRLRRGMTLEQLAELIGTDVRWQYWQKVESGSIRDPGAGRLMRLARALDAPIFEFLRRLPDEQGAAFRTAAEEGVVDDHPFVRRLDAAREGDTPVPVLPEWLDGRDPEKCFVITARKDLIEGEILRGYNVLFAELAGELPANGEVVAVETEHGIEPVIWCGQDIEPLGRFLATWKPAARTE